MKKSAILSAIAIASTVAFADHADVTADASGYYDVTLTTKSLAHSEKTVKKTFTTSNSKGSAVDQFKASYSSVKDLAGFQVLELTGITKVDVPTEEISVKRITFKYSYFDYKENNTTGAKSYVTKVVSESNKGVYDAETGKVYIWDTASGAKVSVTNGGANAIVESKTDSKGVEKLQSGYVAYEVPLAMHKQFVATDDNKAAGGFFGGKATAENGEELDFTGFTAFGTGTMDSKTEEVKSVSGNVAMKDPKDIKYGAYGTWKIQKDSSSKTKSAKDIQAVLRNKGCVELFMERN